MAGLGIFTQVGRTTLIAGTITLVILGVTANTKAYPSIVTPGGTLGSGYKMACSANQLIITSVVAAGTIQALDTSILDFLLYGS